MKLKLLFVFIAVTGFTWPALSVEQGDDNPTGVAGIFNGQITTAGNYDPYTGNAMRAVDDIVVPGSVGAYPLKWTRYFDSHVNYKDNYIGGQWRFSYSSYRSFVSGFACTPDGREYPINSSNPPYGVEEYFDSPYPYTTSTLHLADGGKVVYNGGYNVGIPIQIIDPYGQVTTLSWTGNRLDRVIEPGGRYLQITRDSTNSYITSVQAFDGIAGHTSPTQWVNYTWTTQTLSLQNGGGHPNSFLVLTRADYSDGTFATYTYTEGNYPITLCTSPFGTVWGYTALPATADDVRYNGPMRQIKYQYYSTSNKTRISSEKNLVTGEAVSTIVGVANNNTQGVIETRGDGATRTLDYFKGPGCRDCPPPDTDACSRDPIPTDGKLKDYTDFLGHTTTLTYSDGSTDGAPGFITAVTDANGHTTSYTRQTGSWGITKITYPPTPTEPNGSFITQDFWPPQQDGSGSQTQPYYLWKRTDERGNTTTYTRDSSNRITRKDYPTPNPTTLDPAPAAVYETFTYNSFNEVLTHRLTNGGTETFTYDTRGLKTSYTDALGNVTTYTYYTSGPWTDRIQTVTYPLNASGAQGTETYDYDRAYDANNENSGASATQAPVAGRGLVTRITHADGKYQAFGYDNYGNKLWQADELGHRTTMTYDAYKRVLTTTDPLGHTVTNNYVPTGQTSSWITTSNLPFYTTLPSTKETTFYYDANWRKTRVQQAPGTADEANTYFAYDNLGNLLTTQDPRGKVTTNTYDARNRLTSTTDALSHATSFTYDAHSNKLTETKANGEITTNVYDKPNRVIQIRVTRDANTTDVRNSAYDAASNLMKFQDENATARSDTVNIYTYTYDLRNRVTSVIYPNTLHEDTTYDAAGNVMTYKNRAGAIKTFSQFDVRNRPHRFDWNDGVTPWQSSSYDDASRVTQIANSVSTINNTYLNDNHLSTQEEWTSAFNDNVHRTVTYTYDVDGNRLTVQYPSGTAFNYTYTNRNQVASIKPGLSGGTAVVSYAFDASGNITNRALDNGTSTAYTVDDVNRDTAVVHNLQPTGTAKRFDYAYNSVNDVLAVQRDSALGDAYQYDLTQEITRYAQNGTVNLSNGTIATPAADTNLTFDGCGNQTSLSLNGNNGGTFTVDYLNEYTAFNGQSLTYDSDGDVLTYNNWTYVYDAQNRLTSAGNGTVTASFYYDGLNRQIARSINGVITFSAWDGDWAILEEYGTSNTVTQKYLQGYHGLVKTLQDNIYYYQDELGSTSHVAGGTGALIESYQYDLYGKPRVYNASGVYQPGATPQGKDLFTGQRWVVEIGLYDDRNRFMSPDLGRFLQPDPIGFKGDSSNLYRYCGNDWANRSDPMGLFETLNDAALWNQNQRDEFQHDQQQQQQQQQPRTDPSRGYYGNDRTKTIRSDKTGGPREVSREGKVTMLERQFVDASGKRPQGSAKEGALGSQSAATPRLGVGNPIDAHFISQFGFRGQQAKDMRQLANFMDYGVAYPAAAAVALPVAVPLALNGLYYGGWYATGAATATYQAALRYPGANSIVQQAVNAFITPGGAAPTNGPEVLGTAANLTASKIDPKDFGP
jgi:RHS repeat-associated protein